MKRLTFLFVALFFATLMFTSCFKSRVCECRSSINPSADENFTTAMGSKSKATAECENHQFDGRNTSAPDYTCTLK